MTRRPALVLGLLAVLLVAAFALSVRMGSVTLDLGAVIRALMGRGDAATLAIVRELRLPRATAAALVGAALAVSGVTFQALLRNALAEPYVLGVSGGAARGAGAAHVHRGLPAPPTSSADSPPVQRRSRPRRSSVRPRPLSSCCASPRAWDRRWTPACCCWLASW